MLTSFMILLVRDLATSSALYLSASTVAFSSLGKAGNPLTSCSSPANPNSSSKENAILGSWDVEEFEI